MIIDSKGKLFGKISIIDIIIVVVVLAAALGLIYKFKVSRTESIFTKPDTIKLVIYCEESPDYTAADIKKGDIVKDPVKNAVFGKVTDVKTGKSVSFTQNDKGDIVASSKPGYVSIKVYVEGKGILSGSGATFDNADYSIGKAFEVRVGRSTLWAKISEFKKVEG